MQSPEIAHHLRELQIDDAEWIYRACQDSEIQRWTTVPRPYSRDHAESFVHSRSGELAAYAIVHSLSAETNTASRRSAERAGFTMTGPDTTTCPDGLNQVVALRYEKSVR